MGLLIEGRGGGSIFLLLSLVLYNVWLSPDLPKGGRKFYILKEGGDE